MPDQRVARRTATDLDTLAAQINAEHAACQTALASGLQRAATAGQLLREAKARLSHGQWLPWLQTHFTGSERTAQAYMRVAREGPRLAEENPQRVADLSYRGALQALTAPRPTDSHELRLQQRLDALRAHQAALEADPATQTPEALFAIVEEAEELERDARALGIRATRGMRRLAPTLAPPNLATTSWLLLTLADGLWSIRYNLERPVFEARVLLRRTPWRFVWMLLVVVLLFVLGVGLGALWAGSRRRLPAILVAPTAGPAQTIDAEPQPLAERSA